EALAPQLVEVSRLAGPAHPDHRGGLSGQGHGPMDAAGRRLDEGTGQRVGELLRQTGSEAQGLLLAHRGLPPSRSKLPDFLLLRRRIYSPAAPRSSAPSLPSLPGRRRIWWTNCARVGTLWSPGCGKSRPGVWRRRWASESAARSPSAAVTGNELARSR